MLTFQQFVLEETTFPQEKTGKSVDGSLKLKIKEPRPNVFTAHHKNKRVGAAVVWKDLQHGKPSIYKSETHPDYRKKGVMTAIYKHIESRIGGHLTPSSTLSDDGHAFWSKYRPEAVKNDLRNHRSKLMGKTVTHPKHGEGTIETVGSGVVSARMKNGNTFTLKRDEIKHHLD